MNENSGLSDVRLHLVDSVEKANEFISWLGERRPHNALSVDIETGEFPGNPRKDALSPWHGRIRLVQVGDGMQGWAIPWDAWKGVFYQGMKDYDGPIICHNIAFEARWFAVQSDWELPWHQAHDTMIMAHLMDPLGSGALKRLAALHIDNRSVALQGTLDSSLAENGWTWGTVPVNFEPYWAYGALDTVLTTRLWEKFYPTMFAPGAMYSIPYELEMATRRICTRMEVNGARVDLDYSQKKFDELAEYSASVKKWVAENYKGASSGSNIQLVRVFEEQLGENITATTPSGQKSMTKEQLQLFTRDGSPEVQQLADLILKQRKADKLATSYFSNFINDNVGGYVHPSIRTLGARTGRMSITDPALQTLPSGDATVRRAFIPKDDEHFIISSDLDQVEFRLTANLSQDPSLIRLFHEADATGGDVFTSIMRDVYADQTLDKSDPRRKLIKGCVPLSTKILTKRGWLSHGEVVVGDETLGYNLDTGKSEWTSINGVHVFEDADIYKLSNGHKTFYCTDDHRWIADNGRDGARGSKPKIIYANEFLSGESRLILAADAEDGTLDVTDSEAYLLGWILGDGGIRRSKLVGASSQASGSRVGCEVRIYQTKSAGVALVNSSLVDVPHHKFAVTARGQHVWSIDAEYSRRLLSRADIYDKNTFDPWALASGLTLSARREMIRGLDDADGKNKKSHRKNGKIDVAIVQASNSPVAELVVALGYLTGKFSRQTTYTKEIDNPNSWQKNPIKVVWHQKGTMTNQRASLVYESTGDVWCVTTGLGTWTMRQEHDSVPVLTGNTVYGKLYGAGVDKMALTAKVATEQMKAVVDAFDASYPGVKQLQSQIENAGMERLRNEGQGYVKTRTGRRLPCDDDRVYSLTNYLIQSTAAEIFKQNLVKLDQADLTEHLIVPVHDEIVLQANKEELRDVMATVQECMTTRDGWDIPLTAGVDGPFRTWGDKYATGDVSDSVRPSD